MTVSFLFSHEPQFIIVKTEAGFQKVYYHQIECIEAQNKKVLFYLENNRRIDVLDTFVHCSKELLLNDGFYKCHRSYLVYMPAVDHFNSLEIETKSHKKIPIARSCVLKILKKLILNICLRKEVLRMINTILEAIRYTSSLIVWYFCFYFVS